MLGFQTQLTEEPAYKPINIAQFGQDITDEDYEDNVNEREQFTLFPTYENPFKTTTTTAEPEQSIIIISATKTPPHHCDRAR